MGGRGSGGVRPGSGRKPKEAAIKFLQGTATATERRQVAATRPEVDVFDAPDDLGEAERKVWLKLAPHAFKARTLTEGTAFRFVRLCQQVVLEQELLHDPDERGTANQRGVTQRVDAGMSAFGIAPIGKPLVDEAPKVVDPFEEFEMGGGVQ